MYIVYYSFLSNRSGVYRVIKSDGVRFTEAKVSLFFPWRIAFEQKFRGAVRK